MFVAIGFDVIGAAQLVRLLDRIFGPELGCSPLRSFLPSRMLAIWNLPKLKL